MEINITHFNTFNQTADFLGRFEWVLWLCGPTLITHVTKTQSSSLQPSTVLQYCVGWFDMNHTQLNKQKDLLFNPFMHRAPLEVVYKLHQVYQTPSNINSSYALQVFPQIISGNLHVDKWWYECSCLSGSRVLSFNWLLPNIAAHLLTQMSL